MHCAHRPNMIWSYSPYIMRLSWFATASSLVFAFTSPAFASEPREFILSNGMKVLLVEVPKAPVATVQVWYKVGSRNEVMGRAGLSHMLEHMMFKGTAQISQGHLLPSHSQERRDGQCLHQPGLHRLLRESRGRPRRSWPWNSKPIACKASCSTCLN